MMIFKRYLDLFEIFQRQISDNLPSDLTFDLFILSYFQFIVLRLGF